MRVSDRRANKNKNKKDGPGGGGGGDDDWLDDYAKGAVFELYSMPLEVISDDSSLWGMTFSRQDDR